MNITYIFHSGFLVETKECYYLFDYFKGYLPNLRKEFLEEYPGYHNKIAKTEIVLK